MRPKESCTCKVFRAAFKKLVATVNILWCQIDRNLQKVQSIFKPLPEGSSSYRKTCDKPWSWQIFLSVNVYCVVLCVSRLSVCVHVRSEDYLGYHPRALCDSLLRRWSGAHQPGWTGCLVSPRHLPVSASPACHHAWHFYAGAGEENRLLPLVSLSSSLWI